MKNKQSIFLILTSLFILGIFTIVAINNIPNHNNSSFKNNNQEDDENAKYLEIDDDNKPRIDSIDYANNELTLTTKGSPKEYCIKTTKSTPNNNSVCWKTIEDNQATISVYENKEYYIWLKDKEDNITSETVFITKEND